ncbi:alpha/beta-hydrolase [Meredithblackwellia eburnea MCA 4105]
MVSRTVTVLSTPKLSTGTLVLIGASLFLLAPFVLNIHSSIGSPRQSFRLEFHSKPQETLDETLFAITEPSTTSQDHPLVTAILLHGLGDPPTNLPFVDGLADRFPFIRWVAPQAHNRSVTVRGGASFPAWFDISSFENLDLDEDVTGFVQSARQLHALIRDERDRMRKLGRAGKVIVAGFSQGAVMAWLLAFTAKQREPIDAAIMLSGYVPLRRFNKEIAKFKQTTTPVFWGHGENDPFITSNRAREDWRSLRSWPLKATKVMLRTYKDLEHYWDHHELDDAAKWLQYNLGWDLAGK